MSCKNKNRVLVLKGSQELTKKEGDVGYDLRASKDCTVWSGKRFKIETNVSVKMPSCMYGEVSEKSGNSLNGLSSYAGIIDPSYTGKISVVIEYNGQDGNKYEIKKGQKVAQLIFKNYITPSFQEVEDLPDTWRKEKGFGHTGKF
jgi:dUTP pyrophosphatase